MIADLPAATETRIEERGAVDAETFTREIDVVIGAPEITGRFFYNDDMSGFNFQRQKAIKGAWDVSRAVEGAEFGAEIGMYGGFIGVGVGVVLGVGTAVAVNYAQDKLCEKQ